MDVVCVFSLRRLELHGITLYQTPAYALLSYVTLPPDTLLCIEDYHSGEVLWSADMARQQLQVILEEIAPHTSSSVATGPAPPTTIDEPTMSTTPHPTLTQPTPFPGYCLHHLAYELIYAAAGCT